jgi:thioredoxin
MPPPVPLARAPVHRNPTQPLSISLYNTTNFKSKAHMFFKRRQRPVAPIIHAVDANFDATVLNSPGVTVVDFWAPWCGPCRMMAPILDDFAIEQEDRGVRVVKVNTDEAPDTSERFNIRSIPTLIFFKDGEPLFEMVGMVPKPVLERELDQVLEAAGTS